MTIADYVICGLMLASAAGALWLVWRGVIR
jgi:hypothetical protein